MRMDKFHIHLILWGLRGDQIRDKSQTDKGGLKVFTHRPELWSLNVLINVFFFPNLILNLLGLLLFLSAVVRLVYSPTYWKRKIFPKYLATALGSAICRGPVT